MNWGIVYKQVFYIIQKYLHNGCLLLFLSFSPGFFYIKAPFQKTVNRHKQPCIDFSAGYRIYDNAALIM